MIDPNNVLIRCPNGHQLQAAKTDLDKPLACPVCNVTFTPSPSGAAPEAPPVPAGGAGAPETLSYGMPGTPALQEPVTYPPYTQWMIILWVAVYVLQAINGLYQMANPPDIDPQNPFAGQMVSLMVFGCFVGAGTIAAIVLQLMWIYRIHKDARRARNYQAVSPGLAIGLSLIPLFNLIWTPVTMRKLARFATDPDESGGSAGNRAFYAATVCLVAGIAILVTYCAVFSAMLPAYMKGFNNIQALGPQNMDQQALQREIMASIPAAVQIFSAIVPAVAAVIYYWAVRKLEAALYPFLGALPR